jgi:flagellar motor component MotA
LKLVSRVKSLRDVVAAIAKVLPRLGAIAALLGLIFYIFAVMFTEMFGDLILSDDYFSTLDRSLLTCFQMVTLEWGDIMRECMAQVWWAWIPFVSFIIITGFIIFNLIVAVVCEAVSEISKDSDKERRRARRMTYETTLE